MNDNILIDAAVIQNLPEPELCIVTFMHGSEKLSPHFCDICNCIQKSRNCEVIIFFDEEPPPCSIANMRAIAMPGTKYSRIICLPDITCARYYLFIDNDVECNLCELDSFLERLGGVEWDAAYGRLEAINTHTLAAKMVILDKWISHRIIRPLLWKLRIGISLPGQIFALSREALKKKTCARDTFLDDLAFGLSLRMDNARLVCTSRVLGYEYPNSSMQGLWKQRKRWAIGYADILAGAQSYEEKLLLFIHGLCYHGHWVLMWSIMLVASFTNIFSGLLLIGLFSILIAGCRWKLLPAAFLYQLVFPCLHLRWLYQVIRRRCCHAQ